MDSKTQLLSKLDVSTLKKVAKKEGLKKIPSTYGKSDLIKYLGGVLTLKQVKSYTVENYVKETKREIIRETIKEKGTRQRFETKQTVRLELPKSEFVTRLTGNKEKIGIGVIEAVADYLHENVPTGSGFNLYNKMSEKLLERLYRVFIEKETDGEGRYLEYRFANYILRHSKEYISRLKIRSRLAKIGEIDVLGFDENDRPSLIAEVKDRPVRYEDIDKWVSNVKRAYSEYGGSVMEAYFVGSAGYTEGTIKRLEDSNEIDAKKGYIKLGATAIAKDFCSWNKDIRELGKVFFKIFDVRGNQFVKVLPRTSR